MMALGRTELARAEEQGFARKIRSDPGYESCWERNLPALRRWGFEDLITAVQQVVVD
jgi:hypothetical protein